MLAFCNLCVTSQSSAAITESTPCKNSQSRLCPEPVGDGQTDPADCREPRSLQPSAVLCWNTRFNSPDSEQCVGSTILQWSVLNVNVSSNEAWRKSQNVSLKSATNAHGCNIFSSCYCLHPSWQTLSCDSYIIVRGLNPYDQHSDRCSHDMIHCCLSFIHKLVCRSYNSMTSWNVGKFTCLLNQLRPVDFMRECFGATRLIMRYMQTAELCSVWKMIWIQSIQRLRL